MKILLVRTSSMGDLIHTLPAVNDLAKNRPDIELHWLSEGAFADIPLLHPFVYKVHEFSWRLWRKKIFSQETQQKIRNLNKTLKNEHFDLVIDAQGLLKSALPSCLFAHAPIYGLSWKTAKEPLAALFYKKRFYLKKRHNIIWQNRQLFAQIFDYSIDDTCVEYGTRVPENIHLDIDISSPYHVIVHSASTDDKLWDISHWQDLIKEITKRTGQTVYILWGNNKEYQRSIQLTQNSEHVVVCPKLSLLDVALLLERSQSVIGVDTGVLHLANTFNIPTVGIYIHTSIDYLSNPYPKPYQLNISGNGKQPLVKEVFTRWESACQLYKTHKN